MTADQSSAPHCGSRARRERFDIHKQSSRAKSRARSKRLDRSKRINFVLIAQSIFLTPTHDHAFSLQQSTNRTGTFLHAYRSLTRLRRDGRCRWRGSRRTGRRSPHALKNLGPEEFRASLAGSQGPHSRERRHLQRLRRSARPGPALATRSASRCSSRRRKRTLSKRA